MKIYILFTCDIWKDRKSRVLRGVFTNAGALDDAVEELKSNMVIDKDEHDEGAYFDIVEIEENEYEADGGYY